MASYTSKITEYQANSILSNIFKQGNTIALLTSDPNVSLSEPTGASYRRYTIQSGDFTVDDSTVQTAKHLLYGLCDDEAGWGTIFGFGIYNGSQCLYWGVLTEAKPVGYNTVPVFKKFNLSKKEGIKVTLDVVETASASSGT